MCTLVLEAIYLLPVDVARCRLWNARRLTQTVTARYVVLRCTTAEAWRSETGCGR